MCLCAARPLRTPVRPPEQWLKLVSKRVRSAIVGDVPEGLFAAEQEDHDGDIEGQKGQDGSGDGAAEEHVQGSSGDATVLVGSSSGVHETVVTPSVAEARAAVAATDTCGATAAADATRNSDGDGDNNTSVPVDGSNNDKPAAAITANSTAVPARASASTSTEAELRQRLLAVMGQARNSKDKRSRAGPVPTAKAR